MAVLIGLRFYIGNNLNGEDVNILALIPARMGSTRFPGKPMAKLLQKPMIGHVYENVKKCNLLTKTVVATCDKEIFDYIKSIDGQAIMTSNKHERASDRCAEALGYLEMNDGIQYDIVVMIQGDEPMVNSKMIDEAIKPLIKDKSINVLNLISPINNQRELRDKNTIKVVADKNSFALYFSRSIIPFNKKFKKNYFMKQVCVIPFKRNFILKYSALKETKLEKIESIDMLRVLENDIKVKLVKISKYTHAVDNMNDLKLVEKLI